VAVVPLPLAVSALRQHAVALAADGDLAAARAAAEQVLPRLDGGGVRAEDKRALLSLAGLIDRRSGKPEDAIRHLRAAAALLDAPPPSSSTERTEIFTELGAALLGTRKLDEAVQALRLARQTASGAAAVRVTNDLGAAAALGGHRAEAADLYRAAFQAAATTTVTADERRAIEKNLSDLAAVR
jgi:tetratricopeptide (TPR) repeat protein